MVMYAVQLLLAMDSQMRVALALSILGLYGTASGAVLLILCDIPNMEMLGLLQGFAAGVMLSISCMDLTHNAIKSIRFLNGILWFFSGVIFFACIIAKFIPEPAVGPSTDMKGKKKIGDEGEEERRLNLQSRVFYSGITTGLGTILHKSVFFKSNEVNEVGVNLPFAIALPNVFKGVVVPLPIYFATKSKWEAMKWATVSGLAELAGVIIVGYSFQNRLSPEIIAGLLGAVGGIMAFIALHEMLPIAFVYAVSKQVANAVFVGIACMSASYYFLGWSILEAMSQ